MCAEFLTHTGLRISEMIGLTWEHLELGDKPHVRVSSRWRRAGQLSLGLIVVVAIAGCGGSGLGSTEPGTGVTTAKPSQAATAHHRKEKHESAPTPTQREEERHAEQVLQEEEQREKREREQAQAKKVNSAGDGQSSGASYAGVQYAMEQQGWSEAEAADFVLLVGEDGLTPKQAEGVGAAALTLESHGWNHKNAVLGALEAVGALSGGG